MDVNKKNYTDTEEDLPYEGLFKSDEIEHRRQIRIANDAQKKLYNDMVEAAIRERDARNNSPSVVRYNNARNKSVGANKQVRADNKKTSDKKIDFAKISQKICIGLSALAIVASIGAVSYVAFGDDIKTSIETRENIKYNEEVFREKALTNLLVNNLAEINENGKIVVKNNTTNDYYRLNIDNIYDVYGMSLVLDYGEFDKFIQTVSYESGKYNYVGRNQFLSYNGYVDNKHSEPSMDVFQNIMENNIILNIPKSTLERWLEEGDVFTFEDITTIIEEEANGNVKGGK